jgi:dihydrofolate synthase/folylpolyglutamate synthase
MPDSVWNAIEEIGARAVVPGRDFSFRGVESGWQFEYGDFTLRDLPMPSLTGVHQLGNAATALAAVKSLDVTLTPAAVGQALRTVQLAGRFQRVPGEVEWVLDVAHNVPAALGLAANLRMLARIRTIAVCAILGDKDIAGITGAVGAEIDAWILVALEGPRAVPTEELARQLPQGAVVLGTAPGVASGCRMAREAATPGTRILVFGSFLTVGPALEFLGL